MDPVEKQSIIDEEHLRLLSIFYYVTAGTTAFFACFPIFHFMMGLIFVVAGDDLAEANGDEIPSFIGWFIMAVAGFIMLCGWTIAILKFLAARFIKQRKNRIFCCIVAGISCLAIPFGTVLGIMSIMVLTRKSVASSFDTLTTPSEAQE